MAARGDQAQPEFLGLGAGLADESGIRIVSVRPSAGAAALALNGSISLTDQLGAGSARPWEGWRPADARRELYQAMIQIAETGRGPADQVPSMGCSIKWKSE